jgi:hypothetical protein
MDRQEILLREYEACQRHNDSIGSQVWTSTTIFLSINVTLLGGLLYGLLTTDVFSIKNLDEIIQFQVLGPRIAATVLGLGIIVILCRWSQWLRRMRFHTAANSERMGTIERRLRICKHTIVRKLDLAFKNKKNQTSEQKHNLKKKREFWEYAPVSGFKGLICIAYTIITLWVLSIVYVWIPFIMVIIGS